MSILDNTTPININGQDLRVVKPQSTITVDGKILGAGTIINLGGSDVSPVSTSVDTPSQELPPTLDTEI